MANIFGNVISDSEGRDGSFIVRRIRSAVPRDQKVTNSRHMMAPKLRFSRGLKAKAPGAVTACVSGPLRRRSSKFLQARRPRLAQEATMGKVKISYIFLPSRVFQVYDCYFTNVLTQRSCLGFLLTADSQCFTRNDARTYRRSLDEGYGQASVHCELKRRGLRSQQKCGHFPPGAPVTSFLSQQISTVIRSPRFQQDETS